MSLVRALSALPAVVVLSLFTTNVSGQMYLVVPAGSNNRLAETTDTVQTVDRLFHSGNNARGGYNVGDRAVTAFNKATPYITDYSKMYDFNDIATTGQYEMTYFEGSRLLVQWMNERGCGGTDTTASSVNCELIIQYSCDSLPEASLPAAVLPGVERLVNGGNTGKPKPPTTQADIATVKAANDAALYGRHETEQYYYNCMKRSRNKGLFTSTATLTDFATSTRQNPTGTQAGLECPEERDYYPYWSPSPWRDIVIITDHAATACLAGKYQSASQNNHRVYKCVPPAGATGAAYDAALKPITAADCTAAGGSWTAYTGGLPAPDCLLSPWSKDSHLGSGIDGKPLSYEWSVPSIQDIKGSGMSTYTDATTGTEYARCVMRMRYNVSSDEFDPYSVDASSNGALIPQTAGNTQAKDVTQNGVVNIAGAGAPATYVKVNVNAQTLAATYEDRSHVFNIRSRPAAFAGKNIINLNTRGKRCNIVQCYPDVEYDFAPHTTEVAPDTLVHVQWTGSNTNNNAAGANDDGQDGSAGEGAANTDRQNLVQVTDLAANYPIPLDKVQDNMWSRSTCFNVKGNYLSTTAGDAAKTQARGYMIKSATDRNDAATECALWMMTGGQLRTIAQAAAANANTLNPTLDTTPASLIGGVIMQFNGVDSTSGKQDYYCIGTRNNNFTNRGEKCEITVNPDLKVPTGATLQS